MNEQKKMPKWLIGCLGISLGFLAIIILIIIIAPEPDESDNEVAEKTADLEIDENAKPAMLAIWQQLVRAVEPCDNSNTLAVESLAAASDGSGDIYDAYSKASQALETCQSTVVHLQKMEPPPEINSIQQTRLAEDLTNCQDAYLMRAIAIETMLEVIDGDMRPSKVEEYKMRTESAQSGSIACVAGVISIAMETGHKAEFLQQNMR